MNQCVQIPHATQQIVRAGWKKATFGNLVQRLSSRDQTQQPLSGNRRHERYVRWVVLGLFCALMLLVLGSAWEKSATFDEPYHIAVGYATWKDGVQKWEFNNPAFSRRWISLPLLFLQPDLPLAVKNNGELAHQFVFHNRFSPQEFVQWTRPMTLLAAIGLAWGVFSWSRDLFGTRAGVLSLLCVVLAPNVLAHSGLATTDILTATGFLWTVYLCWRTSRRPTLASALWAGIALGLALTTKFSCLILGPTLWFLLVVTRRSQEEHRRVPVIWITFGVAILVIFVESGLEFISLAEFANEQLALKGDAIVNDWPGWAKIPVPFLRFLYGIWALFSSNSSGRPTFLLGKVLSAGTPLYFPVVFLLKTPAPILGLSILAGISAGRFLRPQGSASGWQRWHNALFLGLPPLLYTILIVLSRINLGYRYLLPIAPFLYIGIGRLAKSAYARRGRLVLGTLILWLAMESLVTFPHYLAYFNFMAGGPSGGYRYLVDSNLDWGQELITLSHYQKANQTGSIHLGYFGSADPAAYDIDFHCLPSLGFLSCPQANLPTEGWIAVSATCLQGLCTADPDFYAPLRFREPVTSLGNSLFLYYLPGMQSRGEP